MKEASTQTVASLAALTFVTGLIDAASVLGIGHVFVANMTGNVVFIGFSLLGQGSVSLRAGVLAMAGFLSGAVIGGRAMKHPNPNGPRVALLLDVCLLTAAGALAAFRPDSDAHLLILLMAGAMGIRTAVVRVLAIPDLTTTVLTLTLAGIAADSSPAGGQNPRLLRRISAVLTMLVGASTGALLISNAPRYIILVAAALEACATLSLTRSLSNQT